MTNRRLYVSWHTRVLEDATDWVSSDGYARVVRDLPPADELVERDVEGASEPDGSPE